MMPAESTFTSVGALSFVLQPWILRIGFLYRRPLLYGGKTRIAGPMRELQPAFGLP